MHFWRGLPLFLAGVSGFFAVSVAEIDPDSVVIVANSAEDGSVELAEYYAEKRGIPGENILALEMSTKETISGMQFVETIWDPLRERLVEEGWLNGIMGSGRDDQTRQNATILGHRIGALVLCKGVPLRVAHEKLFMNTADTKRLPEQFLTTRSSVDSELALLAERPYRMTGPFRNPVFGNPDPSEVDLLRTLRVSRLDGPSYADARRLVDLALSAEAQGLKGRAYVDIGGPHKSGDEWLERVVELIGGTDFSLSVDRKRRSKIPDGEKFSLIGVTDRFDAPALYFGWYARSVAGVWKDLSIAVPPGAVAFHIHSFSASSIRKRNLGWSGPLVARGVAATVGNVYEPYLEGTHNPVLFLETLLQGKSLVEASVRSMRFFSWQSIVLGDPLYRPFKVGLEEQLEKLDPADPFGQYVVIRKMNRILASEGEAEAAAYGKRMFARTPGFALGLKTATLLRKVGKPADALDVLGPFRYSTVVAPDEATVVVEIAREFDRLGDFASALRLLEEIANSPGIPVVLQLQVLETGREIAQRNGEFIRAEDFRREIERRKPPEPSAKKK